ncbi:MAG: hypothetical protein KBT68_04600 [bacterium]|nr:hypothetical protein [Candidatus Colisoma equi]
MISFFLAAVLFETSQFGIGLKVESETKVIDPARSVFLRMELRTPHDKKADMPDLRDRVVGFSLVEDFAEEPVKEKDGSTVQVTNWRLVPEPCAEVYKLKPFVVKASPTIWKAQSDEGKFSVIGGPIYFENPAARDPVTGGMETDPKKDLPPLSWRLVPSALCLVLGAAVVVVLIWLGIRYIARRVKEHRMSPIERAWVELDRLLKKGLPGRGRYKDFYVELTMVVRRYVQRKYGIKAPHLTTEEFFAELAKSNNQTIEQSNNLRRFLESADLVKFAGVEATPEMADEATDSARGYLKSDATATDGNRQLSKGETK